MDDNTARNRLLIYSLVRFGGLAIFFFGIAIMPNTAFPKASVRPTLPNRRLPGVRTRERTSFRPRLRALSASASIRSSLIGYRSRGG